MLMTCCHYDTVRNNKVVDSEHAVNLPDRFSATVNLYVAAIQPGLVHLNATRSACGCLVSCDVDRTAFLAAVSKVLRVAVIDPEDREQVERLAQAFYSAEAMASIGTGVTPSMQAALRKFASPKPPKPDEPLGLGAVVEDADGDKWVRFSNAERDGRNWAYSDGFGNNNYAHIAAVRVLSEGVPS